MKRFDVQSISDIPASSGAYLGPKQDDGPGGDWPVREAIGSLMLLSTMTRPDITNAVRAVARYAHEPTSVSTFGGGGDTTISSPGMATKQPLPGIGLHDSLHGRLACSEFNSFHQGVDQISSREGLF